MQSNFSLSKLQNRVQSTAGQVNIPKTETLLQTYKHASIETATPEKLLIMLYDGAIRFLNIAINAINDKQIETSHKNILKAEAIIMELMSMLDMEVGGQISANLFNLYDFMYRYLVEANIQHDTKKIQDVIDILNELKGAWVQAIDMVNQMKKEGKFDPNAPVKQFAG